MKKLFVYKNYYFKSKKLENIFKEIFKIKEKCEEQKFKIYDNINILENKIKNLKNKSFNLYEKIYFLNYDEKFKKEGGIGGMYGFDEENLFGMMEIFKKGRSIKKISEDEYDYEVLFLERFMKHYGEILLLDKSISDDEINKLNKEYKQFYLKIMKKIIDRKGREIKIVKLIGKITNYDEKYFKEEEKLKNKLQKMLKKVFPENAEEIYNKIIDGEDINEYLNDVEEKIKKYNEERNKVKKEIEKLEKEKMMLEEEIKKITKKEKEEIKEKIRMLWKERKKLRKIVEEEFQKNKKTNFFKKVETYFNYILKNLPLLNSEREGIEDVKKLIIKIKDVEDFEKNIIEVRRIIRKYKEKYGKYVGEIEMMLKELEKEYEENKELIDDVYDFNDFVNLNFIDFESNKFAFFTYYGGGRKRTYSPIDENTYFNYISEDYFKMMGVRFDIDEIKNSDVLNFKLCSYANEDEFGKEWSSLLNSNKGCSMNVEINDVENFILDKIFNEISDEFKIIEEKEHGKIIEIT